MTRSSASALVLLTLLAIAYPRWSSADKKNDAAQPTPTPDAGGGEWPTWGRDGSNNMVSPAKGIPIDFTSGTIDAEGKVTGALKLRWAAEMGSQAYGTTTVKDGRVFIGTNNEKPRDPKLQGDRSVVMCFDEK